MNLPAWAIPLLLAVGGVALALSLLGGPRGAQQPYPSRPWALLGLVTFAAAGVLTLAVAFA